MALPSQSRFNLPYPHPTEPAHHAVNHAYMKAFLDRMPVYPTYSTGIFGVTTVLNPAPFDQYTEIDGAQIDFFKQESWTNVTNWVSTGCFRDTVGGTPGAGINVNWRLKYTLQNGQIFTKTPVARMNMSLAAADMQLETSGFTVTQNLPRGHYTVVLEIEPETPGTTTTHEIDVTSATRHSFTIQETVPS